MHQVAIKQHKHVFVQSIPTNMNRNIRRSNPASLKRIRGQFLLLSSQTIQLFLTALWYEHRNYGVLTSV